LSLKDKAMSGDRLSILEGEGDIVTLTRGEENFEAEGDWTSDRADRVSVGLRMVWNLNRITCRPTSCGRVGTIASSGRTNSAMTVWVIQSPRPF
jgi:hypothetical protein